MVTLETERRQWSDTCSTFSFLLKTYPLLGAVPSNQDLPRWLGYALSPAPSSYSSSSFPLLLLLLASSFSVLSCTYQDGSGRLEVAVEDSLA